MNAPTFAAFVALLALWGADAAISDAQIKKNCQAMTVCYRGGDTSNACTISNGACPSCVTFDNSGCFTLLTTGCPFDTSYNCADYWGTEDATSSASSTTGSTTSAPTSDAGTSTNTTTSHSSHSSASGSSAGTAGTAGSSSTEDSGSDMSVVFAIIGAAIGVIAVAVIFLTLVRRSRAAHDDEDDLAATPPALNKGAPQSTTGAATYATYNRANPATSSASTGEPSVTSYYSQQPQNLPTQSPRVAGRAVPASPRVPVGRAAAVSAASQGAAPQMAPAARAMPMFANKAPLSTPQQQYQQPVAAAAAPVYQQAPPAVQDPAARQATSPRSRRESYEF